MSTSETLLALADRCEREEPSRELDVAILTAALGYRDIYGDGKLFDLGNDGYWTLDGDEKNRALPSPTTSLDAAVTLVPEGRGYVIRSYGNGAASCVIPDRPRDVVHGTARVGANVALAVCAAALRARAIDADSARAARKP